MGDIEILSLIVTEVESSNFKYCGIFDDDFIIEIGENIVVYLDIVDSSFEVLENGGLIGFYNMNNATTFNISDEYKRAFEILTSCITRDDIMDYLREIELSHVEVENYISANKYKLIIDKLCQ